MGNCGSIKEINPPNLNTNFDEQAFHSVVTNGAGNEQSHIHVGAVVNNHTGNEIQHDIGNAVNAAMLAAAGANTLVADLPPINNGTEQPILSRQNSRQSQESRDESIAKSLKRGESYKFSDDLDRKISTNEAFIKLVTTRELTELDQHRWKSKMSMWIKEENRSLTECINFARDELDSLPEIRVVDFDLFKGHGEIPRFGKGQSDFHVDAPGHDLTSNIKSIDRANSFIVFISHSWIVGFDGRDDEGNIVEPYQAEHWRGWPHPDTSGNEKYHLQVQAIEYLWKHMAPGMKKCYIWQDFSCMDQNGNPAGELKQLDKIIEACDCILTPIVDPNHEEWTTPTAWNNYFKDYGAKNFSLDGGPFSYTNRCW